MGWRFWRRKGIPGIGLVDTRRGKGAAADDREGVHKLKDIILMTVLVYAILTVIVWFVLYELTK